VREKSVLETLSQVHYEKVISKCVFTLWETTSTDLLLWKELRLVRLIATICLWCLKYLEDSTDSCLVRVWFFLSFFLIYLSIYLIYLSIYLSIISSHLQTHKINTHSSVAMHINEHLPRVRPVRCW